MNAETVRAFYTGLVETLSALDAWIEPGSPEAREAFLESKRKLDTLWAKHAISSPSESAVGFADARSIDGEKSLIAINFGRMIRMQGNTREHPWPNWMGRYWFNENGLIVSISEAEYASLHGLEAVTA